MRRWTKEARDARRAAAKAAFQTVSLARSPADLDVVVAERVLNTMRHNAAAVMLNRAMSEYADEGAQR